ncbi:MAG: hypothetical protein A2087_06195 [Spirochaetes bacterium GWD1_61_31]|nr:MAG: hypothetical protein A2Y37_01170 [Spirochaetes bacterium GWB1_60_80]OHD35221.1 MAG: hypothetical protein A2004_11325 [Spirochaetes bacterium GWC1_61_12]OHD41783.1 MAG: hypothetical protein A2087_06195 [Spirochaetes bacterium GWD1_61_31]OHD59818.1 MAG: hypothetical protein A2Y32_01480 [Spirochaetes bacterium GWF1_60_12]
MKKLSVLSFAAILLLAACSSPLAYDLAAEKAVGQAPESRAISLTSADAFEQDDTQATARLVVAGGTALVQERNFYDDAYDWLKFDAIAGHVYVIETFVAGSTDTVLTVYDGTTQKATNDDKTSSNYGSKITFTAAATRTYSIKVYSYGGTKGSNLGYNFSIIDNNATPPVDPEDPPVDPPVGGTFTENLSLPQAVRDYYRSAYGLSGNALKAELQRIITSSHSGKSYTGLWTMYRTTDVAPNGKVWDMYSATNATGTTAAYWFTFGTNQDSGSGSVEGQYYNREHTWPNSTFGGTANSYAYSDGHSITPTDKIVNNRRSNYSYGEVGTASWTSLNGSKLGSARSGLGYTGTVFEPVSFYKGDHARMHFYQAVRYYNNGTFATCAWSNSGAKLKTWYDAMLRTWATNDPVSAKEIARNNAVQAYQGNRNPFIDYPSLVNLVSLTE